MQFKNFILGFLALTFLFSCKKNNNQQGLQADYDLSVGDWAKNYLSESIYTSLIVEIQYMEGFSPTQQAIDNCKEFLLKYLNKSEGITFKYVQIPAQGKSMYSMADIAEIEAYSRTIFNQDKALSAYFLFLDGDFSENSGNGKVLGVAYRNSSMAIFEKTVRDYSNSITEPERYKLETTVLNHEFGHILGLVNVGTPMVNNHIDASHGHHCNNEECLMHWSVETGDVIARLLGSTPIPDLDANCKADLRNNGGK